MDSPIRSLLLTIVQAARLSLTTAAFCGLALSAALIGIAAEPGSSRAATVTAGLMLQPFGASEKGGTLSRAGYRR